MRIAIICELANTQRQGGEQHAMLTLARGLAKQAHVDVFSYAPSQGQKLITSKIPLRLRLLPFIRDMFFLPIIGRFLLRKIDQDYDVIQATSSTLAAFYRPRTRFIVTCHIIRSQKIPLFYHLPKYWLLFNPLTYRIMKQFERRGLRNADNVVVIREHQRQFLIDELKISPKKITLIPNGVDVEIFKPRATPKKNQVVFVGRTTFPKGFDLLIDAANYIEGDIIVITQKGASELLTRAQRTPNMQIIRSASPEAVAGHYAESKVFILPSLDEEQPLTVLEALACGLPIVVSEKAASDVFTRASTVEGKVLDYLRPDTIAEAVNYYLRTSTGTIKRNRQIVVEQYSLENNLNHYLRLYEDS